jgi:hypothetical protein
MNNLDPRISFLATVYNNVNIDTNEYSANNPENIDSYEIGN